LYVIVAERSGNSLVLKKLFKALTTLTLLWGCYFGYIQVFAIVVEQLRAIRRTDNFMFRDHPSNSKLQSIQYALETFGPDHWTADNELGYRYYNAERGYWIYAKECERIVEENGVRYDGKRIRLRPFALITKSSDGKDTKTITSDVAVFDLNEPLGLNANAGAEPLKIKHAHLEPNVSMRDHKGTLSDPSDDMKIGPLTTVHYDDETQQIRTELDTYVVIQDPDMVITAYGMLVQLRKIDRFEPSGSSSGFSGAERLDLLKNVHLVMRDVGNSGIMPGAARAQRKAGTKSSAKAGISSGPDAKAAQSDKPTPLDVRCDSMMQVYLPKARLSVLVGPPAPPAPTLVQFERNVVVLRGKVDEQPDQLTCDTLKLSMVPGEKPPQNEAPKLDNSGLAAGSAHVGTDVGRDAEGRPSVEIVARQGEAASTSSGDGSTSGGAQTTADPKTAASGNQGALGGLTLQRAHATGHAVWLLLPSQGVKLRCNELIQARQAPYKPDQTYFRGDRTRLLEIEKVELVEDEGPDRGKIASVTNIWAVDATLFDNGTGMDAANVLAHGPGRLETRPERNQPVERVAIWQDKFILHNELGTGNQVLKKIIYLTGDRPCFIDKLQETMLDSAYLIKVTLKPKPAAPLPGNNSSASTGLAAKLRAGAVDNRPEPMPVTDMSPGSTVNSKSSTGDQLGEAGRGGGKLEIEKLHALRDAHLTAPAKTMTARERLDADFIKAQATHVATTNATGADASGAAAERPVQPQQQDVNAANEDEQVTAQPTAEKPPTEPPMIGSCDRLWAKIIIMPKPEPAPDQALAQRLKKAKTVAARKGSGKTETDAEVRNVWMSGNVALHQDPAEGKTKGQDAFGEALYLDNRGPNQAITYIYQRDPTEKTYLPGPLPPAHVENQDITITDAGVIRMNQGTDQAWAEGPGTLTQMTSRGFLTDKSKSEPQADKTAGDLKSVDGPSQVVLSGAPVKTGIATLVTQSKKPEDPSAPKDTAVASKPTTRAGRPLGERVPMTIGFSENMEFTGRSVDPEGRPAARADFHGIVTAQMEDALLHCKEKMIAFTDQEVPLAQLGKMSQAPSNKKPSGDAPKADNDDDVEKPKPELTLIYCYRDAVAISRKVDPDAPILIEQYRIEADQILAYDRRTGDFNVPGKGKVYYFSRKDNSAQPKAMNRGGEPGDAGDKVSTNTSRTANQRTVTPTSGRVPNRGSQNARVRTGSDRGVGEPSSRPDASERTSKEVPALVLTQIHFKQGMIGRFGAGKEDDTLETRWSEFYGDIESMHAKVPDTAAGLDPDRLPADGFFLTGQTLRLITEPPPAGSPKSAPARNYMKAWDRAYASSNDKVIQGDVITYDSFKDLVYAYGENGRQVIYAEQHATGQQTSPGSARAIQLNPETGALHLFDSDTIQMIDKNTGIRPGAERPADPYATKPKPKKKPFKLPTMNIERRGFTGQ
jgi:hypothetical protein